MQSQLCPLEGLLSTDFQLAEPSVTKVPYVVEKSAGMC